MPTQDMHTTDLAVIDAMLTSIERGDLEQLRRCFRPDALTWHNTHGSSRAPMLRNGARR